MHQNHARTLDRIIDLTGKKGYSGITSFLTRQNYVV